MKLNRRRTICVGFAFFLICMFWQVYDTVMPIILTHKFGLSQTLSGAVMAADNVVALFLLPVFGALSDRTHTRLGRRTPFILVGTLVSAALFFLLAFVDRVQLSYLSGADPTDPAHLAAAAAATAAHPGTLIFFMALLIMLLFSMSVFRSPAVALMPDVTPHPLRSQANAIINLMGAAGGIVVLGLGIVFGTGREENVWMSYVTFFGVIAALMLASLLVFMLTVREPAWAEEERKKHPVPEPDHTKRPAGGRLSAAERRSLFLILASVAFWYMGYNAVTSKYSVYAGTVLGRDYNATLIVAQAAAILSYIPVGYLASRIGRRRSILIGVALLFASFTLCAFLDRGSPAFLSNLLFVLAGIGWATINVNSVPMAVELAGRADVGKYTGYYYTASMFAQIVSPVFSGIFLDMNMRTLFPYGAFFVALSFLTMFFVRHGDSRPAMKKELLEQMDVGD